MFHVAAEAAEKLSKTMQEPRTLDVLDTVAKTSAVGGSVGGMTIGGLDISQLAAVGSFLVALAGLGFHIWFTLKYKRPKNKEEKKQ